MTDPFRSRNRNRQTGKPLRDSNQKGREKLSQGSSGALRSSQKSEQQPASEEETTGEVTAVDSKRRSIALLIDIIVAFILSTLLQAVSSMIGLLVPGFSQVFSLSTIILIILLLRDSLYQGRGIGKNLMGLQVVDTVTGQPVSIVQGLKRNIVFFVPFIIQQLVQYTLTVLPLGAEINGLITTAVNIGCTIYIVLVFPFEGYLTFKTGDGRRFGDQLAGSVVVDSEMDFSNPLGRG
ncbi:MAG: RDD family protein [Candidatus Melainabacteria bacterium]|nr:RDD family protein [Candidatus Melainabacteria bacterium]